MLKPGSASSRPPRRAPRSVPVARRDAQGKSVAAAGTEFARRLPQKLDLVGFAILTAVLLIILVTIAVPLRNYYQGKTEIARLHESIAAKKLEKERLLEDIDKYRDDDYIEQEARRRLGVIEPGETAYRILGPRLGNHESLTTDRQEQEDQRTWYEVLWESVAEDTLPDKS